MEIVNLSRFLIYSIPILLVSGSFLPDLVVSFSSLIFLFYLFGKKKLNYFLNKYFLFFLFFWLYISINSIFSQYFISIKSTLPYLRFGVFFILIIFLFERKNSFFYYLNNVIFYTVIFLLIDSLIQNFYGYNILGIAKDSRISSFFGDEKILGSFVIKILPIYISIYFYYNENKNFSYKIFFILFVSLILILLSAERSALGLYLLYLLLFSVLFLRDNKKILIFILSVLLTIVVTFLSSDRLYKRYVGDLINQLKVPSKILHNYNNNDFYLFTEAHDAMFKTAYKMFTNKPLFGHGTKVFRIKCKEKIFSSHNPNYSCNTHPHNYYIQMLAENGVIGFIFLFITFFYFLIIFIKNFFSNDSKMHLNLIILSNLIFLWPLIPHGNFFNNWISIIFYLSLGIFCSFQKEHNRKIKVD